MLSGVREVCRRSCVHAAQNVLKWDNGALTCLMLRRAPIAARYYIESVETSSRNRVGHSRAPFILRPERTSI